MGETRNEISRLRETRNHPPGRTIPSAGKADAEQARYSARNILPMVRPLSDRWAGSPGRQIMQAEAGVEPHPRCDTSQDRSTGSGAACIIEARAGTDVLRT